MANVVSVSATGNAEIDGLLFGTKWNGPITYSFPDSPGDYAAGYGSGEPTAAGFAQVPAAMQQAVNYALASVMSFTNLSITWAGTNGADIRVAQSSAANPTSYAYYPFNTTNGEGGDVWFGTQYNYSAAALGNYYFATAIHELGHALGLKHSQETGGVANVAVPAAHDDLEFSVMSYRSYQGGPLTGYTNESYGYPQSYMANDILALQTLYGANYNTHSENTVYSWSPITGQEFINSVAQLAPGRGAGGAANRIFETVWDGNGVDSYDLSNYTTGVSINLNPGASSVTSAAQLAYLGNGHYAQGNVYNAYQFNGDQRSLIDNASGGTGNDVLIGNVIANVLNGGGGNDTLTGGGGNDTIIGGSGTDVAVYSGNRANYLITYNAATETFTVADQRLGALDGTDTVTGIENFQFADGPIASTIVMSGIDLPNAKVIVGDFSGDGKTDIAVTAYGLGGIGSYLSNGDGTFHAVYSSQTGADWVDWPSAKTITGDFNGDGKTDVAVTAYGLGGIGSYQSNGDGTFHAFYSSQTGADWVDWPSAKTITGDFNGDGKTDVAVTAYGLGGIGSYQSNGDGTFHAFYSSQTGVDWVDWPSAKTITGDFNGDGKTDVAVTAYGLGGIGSYLSNGDGTFHAVYSAQTSTDWVESPTAKMTTGDFNGDGKTDIAVTAPGLGGIGVYLSNGDGTFHAIFSPQATGSAGASQTAMQANGNVLLGGFGNDLLTGTGANDTFVFAFGNTGHEVISNFQPDSDTIEFDNVNFTTFQQLQALMQPSGPDVVVNLSASESVTLHGVTIDDLHASNFVILNHGILI